MTATLVLFALALATASQAQTTLTNTGPSTSQYQAFPHQDNIPQPGSQVHHHHQWNRSK